ncbi:MFS transporter [Aeromonas veronii]|uniref:MFS transporter n=3 Tax=Aeromonas TaxID=642 RepID=UPI0032EAB8FA
MPLALWALVVGAFGIGTTEFVIAGLLPAIAVDFDVTIPVAANLATSYALGVFVGAPLLIIAGRRTSKKNMLAFLALLFVIGNLVTAIAPTFQVAIIGRLITSLTHGAFFGIGSVLASEMVPKEKRVRAIAFMFSGLTVANLVGVPAGTWLSQLFSWQVTFYTITAIGVITFIAVLALIPGTPKPEARSITHEFAAFGNAKVLLAMGITILGPAAFFTSITYIAPMMTETAGFSEEALT